MNKKIVILIIVIILLSGCINNNDSNNKTITKYKIKIENVNTNYTIIVPLPVNSNGEVKEIINSLQIKKGNGKFEVVNTSYGRDKLGLKISSNKDIEIESITSLKTLFWFSLENRSDNNQEWYDEKPEWFVFFDSEYETQIYIEIRYELDQITKMDGFAVWGNIINGLNSVEGKKLKGRV